MKNKRCESIIVQLVVTTYDDMGRPIDETITQQAKVFRATARDFWAEVDKTVESMTKSAAPPPPATSAPKKKRGARA